MPSASLRSAVLIAPRQLPALSDADDWVLTADSDLVQSVHDCTDAVRVEPDCVQQSLLVNALGQLGYLRNVMSKLFVDGKLAGFLEIAQV